LTSPIHVLGFAGSLRKASYNRRLLQVAGDLLPAGMTLEPYDLAPIPLYNEDLEFADGLPPSVRDFHARLAAADAFLMVTPEYNFSVPGVLKNALDWASRRTVDGQPSPLTDKPAAIFGGGGRLGTARAQLHLRDIMLHNNVHVLNSPQVYIIGVRNYFDAEGNLTDQGVRDQIATLMAGLADWTRRLRGF
jgi:chromate reductase, NAD(P)H dehydrogenase (quinone)